MRDVLVAGGGPVGLAAALYAVRAGLDVAVREPRPGVIDKACGEGLMPAAVTSLEDLGVRLDGHVIAGIRYVDGAARAEAPFRCGAGLGVRRTRLHAALRDRVAGAGVPISGPAVRSIIDRGDHLLVDGEPARYLLAADGLHSTVRRLTGLAAPPARVRRYGLHSHAEVTPWTDFVEVHWAETGEAYVTPVSSGHVGIAVLSDGRQSFARQLADFPALSDRLDGRPLSKVRGAGPLRQRARRRVAGRVLLVGDAGGYVDALTGEGIALGLAQAEAAVDAIRDHDPDRYETVSRRLGRRHDLLTHTVLTATRVPAVRRRIVVTARRLPGVFGAAVDQLARPA